MKYSLYSFVFITLLLTSSCSKSFLTVEDNSLIIRQQYVTDLTTLQHFLNGIYATLATDFYSSSNQVYPDLVADNIKPTISNLSTLQVHYKWNQAITQPSTNRDDVWRIGYQLVRSCSFVEEKAIAFSAQDQNKSRQIQAEACSLRALVHFILVNTFAQSYNFSADASHPGIPYITTSDWTQSYTRNTVAEVYTGMINDLSKAVSLFPSGSFKPVIMNQQAAKALLARCYLYKGDFTKAKSTSIEVATSVPIMTGNNYPSKLFTPQETEALFQLSPSSTAVIAGSYNTLFQGRNFRATPTLFFATKDIADLLTKNPDDVRKSWISNGGLGKDSIRKYPFNVVAGFGTTINDQARSYYQTIIRSSEMYLTAAEASAQTGDESTARLYLDAIRKRANPLALTSTVSGQPLLDSIYTERRIELCFEGLRMFDLLRCKKGVNRIDVATGAPTSLPYPSVKAIAPIPVTDTLNGVHQNAGY